MIRKMGKEYKAYRNLYMDEQVYENTSLWHACLKKDTENCISTFEGIHKYKVLIIIILWK